MRLVDIEQVYCSDCEEKGACEKVTCDVKKMPTIYVVPVVRCRECKHYHADTGWCDQLSYFQTSDGEPCSPAESMDWKMFQENDYCSMGQRKEAEHDVSES